MWSKDKRLSEQKLKSNVHGKLVGMFMGATKSSSPRICYLLRNKRRDLYVIPKNFHNNGVFMADRVTCDEVDLVQNIDVPAKVWDNLRVKEVLRKL